MDCPDRATYLSAANWMGPEMYKSPDPRWGPTERGQVLSWVGVIDIIHISSFEKRNC